MNWIFGQECVLTRKEGQDGWRNSIPGEPITLPCRWVAKRKLVRDRYGKEVMAQAEIWLPAGTVIEPDDELTFKGRPYKVLNTAEAPDINGKTEFVQVWC